MNGREKVIKGLEGVLEWLSEGEDRKCVAAYHAVEDALELLKEPTVAKDTDVPNNGWISVKDRLPETYERTFVGIRNGERFEITRAISDHVLVAYYHGSKRRRATSVSYLLDGEWSEDSLADYPFHEHVITHWMPLPEGPEEGEKWCFFNHMIQHGPTKEKDA